MRVNAWGLQIEVFEKPHNGGQGVIQKLRAFNSWRDDFLIEASTLLLLVGFVMGTVDIFVRGGISTETWFTIAWAIVQALAIDGLFFATWGRIRKATWTKETWAGNLPLVVVGIVLAMVAVVVNSILSYQELNGIVDSVAAMRNLSIDAQTFTFVRAVLVVGVAVLVSLFCRTEQTEQTEQPEQGRTLLTEQAERTAEQVEQKIEQVVQRSVQVIEQVVQRSVQVIEQTSQSVHVPEQEPERRGVTLQELYDVLRAMFSEQTEQGRTLIAEQTEQAERTAEQTEHQESNIRVLPVRSERTPERTAEQVRTLLTEQPNMSVRDLAEQMGVAPSTAHTWKRKALEIS